MQAFGFHWLFPAVAIAFQITILCQEAAPYDIKSLKVLWLYSVALKSENPNQCYRSQNASLGVSHH